MPHSIFSQTKQLSLKACAFCAFLAGGLNPNNVQDAIKIAEPYGVDVNSGCKNESGKKDANKVKLFVANAKNI